MNLWARTTLRQLAMLAVALFFFSCEDETSILGFKNPNEKFQVGYIDIPLNASSVVATHSFITDLRPAVDSLTRQTVPVDGIYVGEYVDPAFGKITASSFVTMYPSLGTALASSAVYDSVTIQLRLNFYGYGFSGVTQKRLAIHQITGDTLSLFNGHRYFGNSPAPEYSVDALGEAVVTVNYDSLFKQAALASGRQDTLLAQGKLNDEFGLMVFNAIKGGVATDEEQRLFKSQLKGLALLPAESEGVLGFNAISGAGQLSRLILHYHTLTEDGAVDDTLTRAFGVDYASFTRYETDRVGTEVDALQPYQSVEPVSDLRYIQSGAPIVTKLDLTPFYVFVDSVEDALINQAQLIIDNVEAPPGLKPHNALMLPFMNNIADGFLDARITGDAQLASSYFAVQGFRVQSLPRDFQNFYLAAIEGPVPATISYNPETSQYSGFMTIFAQSLLMNKKEDRLKHLALMPASPEVPRSVTRTVFHKDNVKLRVFYTRARTSNQ